MIAVTVKSFSSVKNKNSDKFDNALKPDRRAL